MSWVSAGLRKLGSWLSDRWGDGPRLTKSQKAKLQEVLDRQKPRIIAGFEASARSVLSVSINPDRIEESLRLTLHRRLTDLGLPAYASTPISLWIDAIDLEEPTERAVWKAVDWLKDQVRGMRL